MMPRGPAKPARPAAGAALLPVRRRRQLSAIQRDLAALHDDWRAALSHHQIRVEAQFKALARRLEPTSPAAVASAPTPKQAERMVAALDDAHVKPKKGRGKDLRHVERVLQQVLKALPDGE